MTERLHQKAEKPNDNQKRATTSASNLTVSERFCAEDADVVLQSSDNVLFKIRRQQLEANSEAFSGAEAFASNDEVVNLTERAVILDLLLQYMHIQDPPKLGDLDFVNFLDLAEAAHKYGVPFATYVCMEQMQTVVSDHPFEIMNWAFTHGKDQLMDQASGYALDLPVDQVPSHTPLFWYSYLSSWYNVRSMALFHLCTIGHNCTLWYLELVPALTAVFETKLGKLKTFDFNIPKSKSGSVCAACVAEFARWKASLTEMRNQVRPLSKESKARKVASGKVNPTPDDPESSVISQTTSERFCAADTDITLESCDGVLFKIRRRQLLANSAAFAEGKKVSADDEVVCLPEPAVVLDLLLQYQEPPDLSKVELDDLLGLADAARKYGVPFAVYVSTKEIGALVPEHPLQVMCWAIKHGHKLYMDQSAEHLLKLPLSTGGPYLWFKYLLRWQILHSKALLKLLQAMHVDSQGGLCVLWRDSVFPTLARKVGPELGTLTSNFEPYRKYFDWPFQRCRQCEEKISEWVSYVHELRDGIPPFSAEYLQNEDQE